MPAPKAPPVSEAVENAATLENAATPEKVMPAKAKAKAKEAEPVLTKTALVHKGVSYKIGTPIDDVKDLSGSDVARLRRLGCV